MGVQDPVDDVFADVPATPPGVQDLGSDDDLFSQTVNDNEPKLITTTEDFFKGILTLPYKGNFELIDIPDDTKIWGSQHLTTKKKGKQCPTCMDDVTKDLKKLEQFVQKCKKETDDLKAENEYLKKELEELKKHIKRNDNDKDIGVKISIDNKTEEKFEVLLKNGIQKGISDTTQIGNSVPELKNNYGIKSFSISLPKEKVLSPPIKEDLTNNAPRSRKTVAQLRKEFFEKEFQGGQKNFKSQNYLEIKPKEKKDTFRSRLTVKITPKPRIAEVISKLTSFSSGSKLIPEAAPISMFQRFERNRIVWQNDFNETLIEPFKNNM